jgi:hypothetical protein
MTEPLMSILRKIANLVDCELYPHERPTGLGFDWSFIDLTDDEITAWREFESSDSTT